MRSVRIALKTPMMLSDVTDSVVNDNAQRSGVGLDKDFINAAQFDSFLCQYDKSS